MSQAPSPQNQTTRLLQAVAEGTSSADELVPHVYEELRQIARRMLGQGRAQATLQPTALIHEAYVRLVGRETMQDQEWEGRRHFLRVAAHAMRSVLVDHARARTREKRGGGRRRVTLDDQVCANVEDAGQLLEIHDLLERLGSVDPPLAQIVELRIFGGLTVAEVADVLGTSPRTVDRSWRLARAWWIKELDNGE